jgi:hypothetical protein
MPKASSVCRRPQHQGVGIFLPSGVVVCGIRDIGRIFENFQETYLKAYSMYGRKQTLRDASDTSALLTL